MLQVFIPCTIAAGYSLPIMMVSANSETKDVLKGLEHGANDYIRKPFQREDLHMRVQVSTTHIRLLQMGPADTVWLMMFDNAGPHPHNAAV